ncbi:MAG: peptide chain release factor N(5)-glutamine methyltransferase [Rickettsiaceae bacterium]|nr:peptide chain release factor N(5)-glutamine methyltransferase [Rickettsiaceae bacterium]
MTIFSIKTLTQNYSKLLPVNEVRILICNSLGLSHEEFILSQDYLPNNQEMDQIALAITKRTEGTPISYITGYKEFYGLDFIVSSATLIPRSETEIIVDEALNIISSKDFQILDLGTGTGAIAISIAINSGCSVHATDVSQEALKIAKQNIVKHEVNHLVTTQISNWFQGIKKKQFDIITCNPPYIAYTDSNIEKNVDKYEPHLALYSGKTGLECYEIIAKNAGEFLKKNGVIILECGASQSIEVIRILKEQDFSIIKLVSDLSSIERTILAQKIQ